MTVQAKYILKKELTTELTEKTVYSYYPFGMPMPNRTYSLSSGSKYRFGYQGSEKDNEIYGDGNTYTTHFRGLDVRLGRWFSTDPKASEQPWQSPYNSMDNNPINLNDVLGDETDPKSFNDEKFVYAVKAFGQSTKENVKGVYNIVRHPYNTVVGLMYALFVRPDITLEKSYKSLCKTFKDLGSSDPKVSGNASGRVIGNLAFLFAPEIKSSNLNINYKNLDVWKGADAERYLSSVGGNAAYMSTEKGGIMILKESASKAEVLEEMIHHTQRMKHGEAYFLKNRNSLEVQAQDILLNYAKKDKWSKIEIDKLKNAKEYWMKQVKKETKE